MLKIKRINSFEGVICTSGSKNTSLPVICASIIPNSKTILTNVSNITDVKILIELLKDQNIDVFYNGDELTIDSRNVKDNPFEYEKIKKIRASYYLLGVFLGKRKRVLFTYPGGCSFQNRPIDLHLYAFECLGVKISFENDHIIFDSSSLHSGEINFKIKSLGATINAILLSCQIEGKSIIDNPSLEIEVIETINFINKMGGFIYVENNKIIVEGRKKYYGVKHRIISDRMECGTFALFAASLGKVLILDIDSYGLKPLFELFDKLDVKYKKDDSYLLVEQTIPNKSLVVKIDVFPGFPSDLGPILVAYLLLNKKISIIEENVYPNRTSYIKELIKIGAKIKVFNNKIIIFPNSIFSQGTLIGKDLRGTMSLILASMISQKDQIIQGEEYIKRGYENFNEKLNDLNAIVEEFTYENN